MKKFVCKLLAAILLLGALTGVLTACKKDTSPEPDQYAVRMDFNIESRWPEISNISYRQLYTKGYIGKDGESLALDLDIDGCPRISVTLREVSLYNITKNQLHTFYPHEEYISYRDDNCFLAYQVTTKDGDVYHTFAHDIYDTDVPETTGAYYTNYYQLQRVAGLHQLWFHYPNRNIDATFNLNITIKGDSRAPVTLRAEESDDYTKLTNVDGRDLFIMKQGIGNDNKFLPHIGVYNQQGETVLDPMFPTEYNAKYEAPHVKAWFEEMNEYYKLPMSFINSSLAYSCVSYPEKSGVYLVSFTYTGDELYQADDYTCYVVIP